MEAEQLVVCTEQELAIVAEADGEVGAEGMVGAACRELEVTIIRAGLSANGMLYPAATLRSAVTLFEGSHAYVDHPGWNDLGRSGGRSVRDLAGVYHGARFDDETQSVKARLRLLPTADWLGELVGGYVRDREAGKPVPRFGISVDMLVRRTYERTPSGRERPRADHIERVNSADIVVNPAAGGRFDRILESEQEESVEPEVQVERTDDGGTAGQRDGEIAGRGDGLTGGAGAVVGDGVSREGSAAGAAGAGTAGAREASTGGAVTVVEARRGTEGRSGPAGAGENRSATARAVEAQQEAGSTRVLEAAAEAERVLEQARAELRRLELQRNRAEIESALAGSGLPAAAQEHLRRELASGASGRIHEAGEVESAIAGMRLLLGTLLPSPVRGMGQQRPDVALGATGMERLQAAMDRLFGLELPEPLRSVPKLSGIREAYLQVTGDVEFTGQLFPERVHVLEANEVTTSVMANVVGTSMNKRLVRDYRGQARWWEPFVIQVDLRDMRQQERVLLNDFASLSTVNENAAYANIAWDDNKESYTPVKKGGLVYVTMETIINDDLRAVTHIPTKLARAATVTINEYVAALFTANAGAGPAMTDGFNVFDATNHQGNSRTEALSTSSVQSSLVVMAKYTNTASKRIGIRGRYLLVPPDLVFTAQIIAKSSLVTGSANNDINVLQGVVEPIPCAQFTDPNNWYLLADPSDIEYLELGFLQGRREPELLLQDSPTVGSVFTNDAITWKIRHIYGGTWLDYRGGVANIVA